MASDDLLVLELAFPGPERDSGLVVTERFRLIRPGVSDGA
jgi:hypothetical protein